jgi:acyl-CoA synthetase (NDP forming)
VLRKGIKEMLVASRRNGWVLEPDAKTILHSYGIGVPQFIWARSLEEAREFVRKYGFPVVGKVISPLILHKSDAGGVVTGIDDHESLGDAFRKFSQMEGFAGMMVEKMVSGIELMAGAKVDYQFGPVILLGMGGTGVEVYRDTVLRMAPLAERDVPAMMSSLKAHPLLEGYRGSKPVDAGAVTQTLLAFSDLVMDIHEFIESVDLNPVLCSEEACIVADARIMLTRG